MELTEKVRQSFTWKQTPQKCAERIGISLKDYLNLKSQILNPKHKGFKERVTSNKVDLEKGTGVIEGELEFEPLSADEIIRKFKIDTTQWKLQSYWNKEKQGGGYFVSANICRLKPMEASKEDFEAIIRKVFNDTPFTKSPRTVTKTNDKALFVYTSDKHIGAYVSGEAIYENNYDALTFAQRMRGLVDEILYMVQVYGTFSDIFIMDMGDALDGQDRQTTRGGHALPQNMSNKAAFETYLAVHKNFFDEIITAGVAANYHAYNLTEDNHAGDFGYYATRALEQYLNLRYPQLKTYTISKFVEHFTYGSHTFILTHGKDSEDMKHGFPLQLNDKAENFIHKYIRYHNIESDNIHFIKGDLHQEASQDTSEFRYRNVLSMFGSSKWMMNNFSATSKGGCSMEVVEKHTHRIFPHRILFK